MHLRTPSQHSKKVQHATCLAKRVARTPGLQNFSLSLSQLSYLGNIERPPPHLAHHLPLAKFLQHRSCPEHAEHLKKQTRWSVGYTGISVTTSHRIVHSSGFKHQKGQTTSRITGPPRRLGLTGSLEPLPLRSYWQAERISFVLKMLELHSCRGYQHSRRIGTRCG